MEQFRNASKIGSLPENIQRPALDRILFDLALLSCKSGMQINFVYLLFIHF